MTTTLKRSKPLLRSWEIMRIFCVIDLIFIIDVSICHTWMILLYRETPKNFPTNYTQKIKKLWGFVEAWASSLKKLSLRMPIFFTFVECGNPTKKKRSMIFFFLAKLALLLHQGHDLFHWNFFLHLHSFDYSEQKPKKKVTPPTVRTKTAHTELKNIQLKSFLQ